MESDYLKALKLAIKTVGKFDNEILKLLKAKIIKEKFRISLIKTERSVKKIKLTITKKTTMNKTFKTTINGQQYEVDDNLTGFTINARTSSLIDFIAVKEDKLFVQFSKGSNGVLYENLPVDLIREAVASGSIGKFWHANLKDKYEATKVSGTPIKLHIADESDFEPDDHEEGLVGDDDEDFDFEI